MAQHGVYRPPDVSQRSVTHVTELYLLRHHVFHWLADALPSATQRARSDRPDDKRSLLCYEQALPGAQGALRWLCLPSRSASAARRCREGGGRRLHDEAVVARFRRVVCGACHAQRWWGQKLWMFEASLGVFGGLEGFELAVWGGERW